MLKNKLESFVIKNVLHLKVTDLLNSPRIFMMFMYVCMYRMTNDRLEIRIFLLTVEVTRLMLILPNHRTKLLERR